MSQGPGDCSRCHGITYAFAARTVILVRVGSPADSHYTGNRISGSCWLAGGSCNSQFQQWQASGFPQ